MFTYHLLQWVKTRKQFISKPTGSHAYLIAEILPDVCMFYWFVHNIQLQSIIVLAGTTTKVHKCICIKKYCICVCMPKWIKMVFFGNLALFCYHFVIVIIIHVFQFLNNIAKHIFSPSIFTIRSLQNASQKCCILCY